MAIIIAAFLFFLIGGAIALFGYQRYVLPGKTYEKLKPVPANGGSPGAPLTYSVASLVEGIGNKLPPPSATSSLHRTELVAAGYRSASAPRVYYGAKLALMASFCAIAILLQFQLRSSLATQAACIGIAALAGFRLPDFVIARRVKRRRLRLRQALPDALDLMVVCAESGMALDRTLRVVGRELAEVHPALSEELNLVTLEVSAGSRRREALENLASRTQEPVIRRFAAVLIQADRFGTEISDALRTHAEWLRVRRRIDAEERAAKVSIKLVFPILLLILPCILLVTIGPAVLQVWKNVLPAIRGT
jgi:tight adherence protein C